VQLFDLNKHFADPAIQRRILFVKISEKDFLYNHTHTANLLKKKLENCFDPVEREILVNSMNSCINKVNLKKRTDLFNEKYNKELRFRPLYNKQEHVFTENTNNSNTPNETLFDEFGDEIFPEVPFPEDIQIDVNSFNNL